MDDFAGPAVRHEYTFAQSRDLKLNLRVKMCVHEGAPGRRGSGSAQTLAVELTRLGGVHISSRTESRWKTTE
jgi:hypothetical protein